MEISKRGQPNFAKRWTVNDANNLLYKSRGRPSQKWGPKTFTFVRFFDDFETSWRFEYLLSET